MSRCQRKIVAGVTISRIPPSRPIGSVPASRASHTRSGHVSPAGTISYYLCWSPRPVPLAKLIEIAVARWKIEEDHQMSKQVTGLDSGQVTTWTSWHRWTATSLIATHGLCGDAATSTTPARHTSAHWHAYADEVPQP
jgi:SRSO17 transposase